VRVFALACLLSLAAPAGMAKSDAEARAELQGLKKRLLEQRAALKALDNKERSVLSALGALDETLVALERAYEGAQAEEAARRGQLERSELEGKEAQARLQQVSERLLRRMRAAYVLGEGGAVRALVGAESFEELSLRRRLLERLAESDGRLVQDHTRAFAELSAAKARHTGLLAAAEDTRQRIEEERELLVVAREERRAAVARLDDEKELRVRAVKEIVERQRTLGALVHALARTSRPRRGSGVLQAGLSWPVQGTLIRRFGTIREKGSGARITSNGLHLRAPLGSPVAAAAAGNVVHVGWVRGFGQLVIIDHGEGHYTLYGHLSRVLAQTGQELGRGEVLGLLGDTESLVGPMLYFELRTGSAPQDPEPFLR
jgi:murein hydrolase activator